MAGHFPDVDDDVESDETRHDRGQPGVPQAAGAASRAPAGHRSPAAVLMDAAGALPTDGSLAHALGTDRPVAAPAHRTRGPIRMDVARRCRGRRRSRLHSTHPGRPATHSAGGAGGGGSGQAAETQTPGGSAPLSRCSPGSSRLSAEWMPERSSGAALVRPWPSRVHSTWPYQESATVPLSPRRPPTWPRGPG